MPDEPLKVTDVTVRCDCCGKSRKGPLFVKVTEDDDATTGICFTCFMEAFRGARLLPALCRLMVATASFQFDLLGTCQGIYYKKYKSVDPVLEAAAALQKEIDNV